LPFGEQESFGGGVHTNFALIEYCIHMYEMSFFWNNNICCGCTGFLRVLWAFTAENRREEKGHNQLLIA